MEYFWLKLAHIVSATLLFGAGLGTAFFFWMAVRGGNVQAIAVTARTVVLADTWFTAPAVVVQPLTGALLIERMGLPWRTSWIVLALALYALAGACWLPVLWLQWRMRELAADAARDRIALPEKFHRYFRFWFALGWPAFIAVLAIFWLMVMKPALW
jgi:uncharacterized membrane protein